MIRIREAALFAAAISALALGYLPSATAQDKPIELKASIFLPPSSPPNKGADLWIKQVEEKSKGRIKINVFPSSQMGPPPRQFDLARTGVADISLVLHGLTPGRFALTELAHIPGVIKDGVAGSKALNEMGTTILAADHPGVKILELIAIQPILISRSELKTANDLKGKRIRAAGSVQSAVFDAMGAVPVLIQPGEMNEALAKGMIDGASVGYSGVLTYHLNDPAKFVLEGDLGTITFAWVMNQATYDKLPADLKKVIDETSGVNSSGFIGKAFLNSELSLGKKYAGEGIKVQQLTEDAPLQNAAKSIRDQAVNNAESKGLPAKEFLGKLSASYEKHKNAK